MDLAWIVVPLGIFAGGLTTIAGIGGGMVLTLVLAAVWDPHLALAVTTPALLLGGGHRLWLFRRRVDRSAALSLALPAVVGAAIGGLVTAGLSDQALRWLLLAVTVLALIRERGWVWLPTGRPWLWGGGILVGFVTATTGAGGLVLAPLMLAAGLRGTTFVATGAAIAITMHVVRVITYGSTGMLGLADLPLAIVLGLAILFGNLLGQRLRPRLGERVCHRLTWGVLLAGLALALVSLGG